MLKKRAEFPRDRRLPRKIDWYLVEDMITALFENGKLKYTPLSTICQANYRSVPMYLNWLESMELIRFDMEDGFKVVKLTTRGIEWYRKNIATRRKQLRMIELD